VPCSVDLDGALVVRGAGQVDRVLVHEVTRARFAASARSVGVAGTLDPEVGVGAAAMAAEVGSTQRLWPAIGIPESTRRIGGAIPVGVEAPATVTPTTVRKGTIHRATTPIAQDTT
jgi:hypothetical protein